MSLEYLDEESENTLRDLLIKGNILHKIMSGTAIEWLVKQGYVEGSACTTLSNTEPMYVLMGITQKGKSYFAQKELYEKEQKKLSQREWKIAIISAVLGALIGLLPAIIPIIVNLFG
jgi:hypothetical protein